MKCFICSSPFKNKTTFTLVPLGREVLWFCAAHTPEGEKIQQLSGADAQAQLVKKKRNLHDGIEKLL